ncbi:hypothetical protein, partial [Pseudomonas aeruginosa]
SHKHNRLPIPYRKGETVSCLSGGSFSAQLKDWGIKGALRDVKAAANNPGLTGDHCRHAVASGDQAKAQITFEEAKAAVLEGVNRWIAHLDQQGSQSKG